MAPSIAFIVPGIWQLLIVLVIILVVFGTTKLRNIGGDLGGAIKNFKHAMGDHDKEEDHSEGEGDGTQAEERIESQPEDSNGGHRATHAHDNTTNKTGSS